MKGWKDGSNTMKSHLSGMGIGVGSLTQNFTKQKLIRIVRQALI